MRVESCRVEGPSEPDPAGPLILPPPTLNSQLPHSQLQGEQRRIQNAQRRADAILAYDTLLAAGHTPYAAQRILKREAGIQITPLTIYRWKKLAADTGSLKPNQHRSGRKPAYMPTHAEIALVRRIWQTMDDSKAGGSDYMAFQLVAHSAHEAVTEQFRQIVLRRRTKTLPPSWRRLLDAPKAVIDYVRDPKTLTLNHINTPRNRTYIDLDGREKPLQVGTLFESDDGTINFPCWVEWPFAGDPCSEKYGVRCGRYQLLPVVDVHSGFCPAWHFVVRPKSSYRGEDAMALLGDVFCRVGRPQVLRLERGSWESDIVQRAVNLAGVPVRNAWLSKHKAVVEGFFDRLWTPLSLVPGHVGRDRDRYTQVTDLLLLCQDGREDPRKHFISYPEACRALELGVTWANAQTKSDPHWGNWIPQARWETHYDQVAARRLHPEMATFFLRDQHDWTIRGNAVGGAVEGPMIKFSVYFQHPAFWEFGGCKTKVYFDPYAEPCLGTIVLQHEWRTYKPGHIIARDVPALDRPPQIVLAAEGTASLDKYQRSLQIRKQIANYVRTEAWHWLGGRTTAATRDGAAPLLTLSTTTAAALPNPRTPAAIPARSNMADAFE